MALSLNHPKYIYLWSFLLYCESYRSSKNGKTTKFSTCGACPAYCIINVLYVQWESDFLNLVKSHIICITYHVMFLYFFFLICQTIHQVKVTHENKQKQPLKSGLLKALSHDHRYLLIIHRDWKSFLLCMWHPGECQRYLGGRAWGECNALQK